MSFVSYAQNFEDVMLWRALKHVECGFYIDVGANDPEIDSVTKAFYDRGWRGINIEPVAQWYQRLEEKRPRDINLQIAAGSYEGELVLYELPDTGLSTIDKATAERHENARGYTKNEKVVPVEKLTSICQRFHLAPIHFLKIDVEGAEKDVLDGFDLSIVRPWIIVVESTLPNTQIEDHLQWDLILCVANYECVYFDGLNRYYVAYEHLDLKRHFNAPPNVFDGFMTRQQLASELRAQAAEGNATEAESRATEAESRATEAESRAIDAESRAIEAESRAIEAESRAIEAESRAIEAESRAIEAELRAIAAESRAIEAESRAQEQENRSLAAEAHHESQIQRIEELDGYCHHWRRQADALKTERDALRQSWSWRSTAPFRWGGGLAILAVRGIRQGATHFVHNSTQAFRYPLVVMMRLVLRNPSISYRINQRLLRYPALYQKLLGVARAQGVIPSVSTYAPLCPQSTMTETDIPGQLTPRARQIYQDLKTAIESHWKENS